MQYDLGVMAHDASGKVGAFVRGNLNRGDGLSGGSFSIGVRLNF
jgi:hypothetical protein